MPDWYRLFKKEKEKKVSLTNKTKTQPVSKTISTHISVNAMQSI
jgi:hypothetical protein